MIEVYKQRALPGLDVPVSLTSFYLGTLPSRACMSQCFPWLRENRLANSPQGVRCLITRPCDTVVVIVIRK